MDFLQAVAVKSPRIIDAPLSLRADKNTHIWFRQWSGNNLPPTTNTPQYHTGITGLLSDVATRLQHTKYLHPVIAAQHEAYKETTGWDFHPPTAQQVILAASASDRTSTLIQLPPTIHQFLNTRNATNLQVDCDLCRSGHISLVDWSRSLC